MSATEKQVADLPRVGIGNTSTAGQAPRAGRSLPVLALKLLTLSAMLCALPLAGCASNSAFNSAQRESGADPNRYSELRISRPDRALLAPQPAPDCGLTESENSKSVDPDQLARLKLDYELQCYKRAEQLVRDRLRLLQKHVVVSSND
jgi:hypothetical protein